MMNSLKGKILLAVSALAVVNCVLGLAVFQAASFFISHAFFSIVIAFLLSTFTTLAFGWWLSKEVLRPIEKVSLLAKSLERSPATSLPKTTGSNETDELLGTLHRNSQQLQNLIGMMDAVSSGKTGIAMTPLQNADRLSASFQQLVSKVTDSIDAKKELDELRTAVSRITSEISGLKEDNLNVEIRGDFEQTREIADAFKYLISRLNGLAMHVHVNSRDARMSLNEAQKAIRSAIDINESRDHKLNRAAAAINAAPGRVRQLSDQLSLIFSVSGKSLENLNLGNQAGRDNASAIDSLRNSISDALRTVQKIHECSQNIPHVAKTAEDLARRANLIALNTSIKAAEAAGNASGVSLLADEIASLSVRAESVNKDISSINDSILREASELESALRLISEEITVVTEKAVKSIDSVSELESFVAQLVDLPAKITEYTAEEATLAGQSLQLIKACSSESEGPEGPLQKTEYNISKLSQLVEVLQDSITDFRVSQTVSPTQISRMQNTEPEPDDLGAHADISQTGELLDMRGEN